MKPTFYEKLIARLQNHRLVAILILVGTTVIALSALTDAFRNITHLFPDPDPAAIRLKLAGLSVPYTPEEFVERAAEGDLTLVKLFLAAGMDPNTILGEDTGPTALFLAARENHPEVVKALLEAGAKVINHESNSLEGAAQSGNVAILNLLLKKTVDRGRLDAAVRVAQNRRILEVLLAHGADLKKTGPEALLYASDPEVLKFLVDHGADINTKDSKGRTLIERMNYDTLNLDTLNILIARGADITLRDQRGWTLLHSYASKGAANGLSILLAKGLKIDALTPEGRTPLSLASDAQWTNTETVQFLLENGADANAKDHTGKTPLYYARQHGRPPVIRLLLDHGAKEEPAP